MVVDGEGMMGTCDYRVDRINVEISNQKIVKILGANWKNCEKRNKDFDKKKWDSSVPNSKTNP